MRPPAGGVHLLAGRHVARTHSALLVFAALAHANTARRSLGKVAMIVRKQEVGFEVRRIVVGAEAKIFIELVRIDQLAGVHLPLRVPDALEFAKSFDQLRTKHFFEQLAA